MPEKANHRLISRVANLIGVQTPEKRVEFYRGDVADTNKLEAEFAVLSDEALKAKTAEFKSRLSEGEELENLLPEAFAAVREASKRTIGLRHHDVQIIGGGALFDGSVAEMRTGEGKTLVATLPLYLKALEGKGAHLVTVNDYLARRDARWMAPIFNMLGMSVGVLQSGATTANAKEAYIVDFNAEHPDEEHRHLRTVNRKDAYDADVTYGTNSEFGFDYLRDNMVARPEDKVQRPLHYAIIDEVDNVLIDEAGMPLIISGPSEGGLETYAQMAQVVSHLTVADCEINQKDKTVSLTKTGAAKVEQLLGEKLAFDSTPEKITLPQALIRGNLEQALRAKFLFHRNKEYLVQAGKVVIVDEFTGRLLPSRRWQDGLHQALEAKEGVKIQPENITYALISLQNYFRMYKKLAGMTATGMTEAQEFKEIYNLDVVPIPPNNPDIKRIDEPDEILKTEDAKLRKIVSEIVRLNSQGRPVLIGTVSVEDSDKLSELLSAENIRVILKCRLIRNRWLAAKGIADDGRKVKALEVLNMPIQKLRENPHLIRDLSKSLNVATSLNDAENIRELSQMLGVKPSDEERLKNILGYGVAHKVLNARKHAMEAEIIAGAGAFGAVTIATNMAGRGVDIKLGGELPEEVSASISRILALNGVENAYTLSGEDKLSELHKIRNSWRINFKNDIQIFEDYMQNYETVKELGGLHVIGSERHNARRIDNQLRGRAARQADPGSSKFYLSLQDELMQKSGGETVSRVMELVKADDGFPIDNPRASKSVETAQARVEGANFDVRKHLLEYDDVINSQRRVLYSQRDKIMLKASVTADIVRIINSEVSERIDLATSRKDLSELTTWLESVQPAYEIKGVITPSFNDRIMLEVLNSMEGGIQQNIRVIAVRALRAEQKYSVTETEEGGRRKDDNMLSDIFRDVDRELKGIQGDPDDQAKLRLLRRIAYGVRTVTHPTTNARGLQIYRRLNFAYAAAEEIERRRIAETGILAAEVTAHLQDARHAQILSWGEIAMQSPERPQITGVADTKESRGSFTLKEIYRQTLLASTTFLWQEYLTRVEALRTGIGLEAYAKQDPLTAYKKTAGTMFGELLGDIRSLSVLSVYSNVPAQPDWETFARSTYSGVPS